MKKDGCLGSWLYIHMDGRMNKMLDDGWMDRRRKERREEEREGERERGKIVG